MHPNGSGGRAYSMKGWSGTEDVCRLQTAQCRTQNREHNTTWGE